jgi:hypothetical protein
VQYRSFGRFALSGRHHRSIAHYHIAALLITTSQRCSLAYRSVAHYDNQRNDLNAARISEANRSGSSRREVTALVELVPVDELVFPIESDARHGAEKP